MNNINSAFLETKANNRLNALRLLFANESLSRTEIASFLGISTAAVTSIVNEFLESGLIIQCEESVDSPNKKAGRKQSPLKINYNWKYIVCFDIHPASVNIAITNLHGKLIVEEPFTFSSNWNKKEFCSELAKECIKILWNHSIHLNQILGAGVSVIGPVNHLEGIALHPYRVFEGPVPFKELLENELPFPITVESNVCAFLQSELLYRTNIENAQNILMLKWGPGVGSATAINGHIYKGYNYQSSETEMKEAKLRMEDALAATRAAVEEGIIAGGGSAYIHASKEVAKLAADLEGDEKTGANIILKALEAPLFRIAANAGLEGAVIINKVRESEPGVGFDALNEKYVNMVDEGILDPAKVTRSALQNATSVASTLLTTESVVANIKEDTPAMPAGGQGMGMM